MADIQEYNKKVFDKIKEACKNSDINTLDHFADVGKMIDLPKGVQRETVTLQRKK